MRSLLEQAARLLDIGFAAPQRLWLAAPLAAVLLLAPLLARRARPRLLPILSRGLLLAALVVVVLEPSVPVQEEQRGKLVVLADVSPSVGGDGIDAAGALLARAGDEPFDLIAVGATPRLADRLEADPRPRTDIGAALRFAAARADPGAPTRVVLVSDGRATEPGMERAAVRLRGSHVELWAYSIPDRPPERAPEVSIEGIEAPPPRARTQPFELRAEVEAESATRGKLALFVDGERVQAQQAELPAGRSEVVFPGVSLAPGRYHVQVLAGTSMLSKTIVVPGKPKVLLLAAKKRRSLIAEALEKQDMQTTVAAPAEAGPLDERFDVVVILPDAPAEALDERSADLFSFVGRRGGGLLAVGGAEGPGLARLHATPTAQLLPLDVEPRTRSDESPAPPRPTRKPKIEIVEEVAEAYPISLCLVVDRSGSMRGRKMQQAIAAAAAAAKALTKHDRISVVGFGDEVVIAMRPRPAGDARTVERALRGLQAYGRTAMFAALRMGYAVLKGERTPIRHLVLVSDGIPTDNGRWRDLVNAMVREKITLSTVGIGFDIDNHLLGRLAAWGHGRFWLANHPHRVPQVVTQDTQRIVADREKRGKDADRSRPKQEEPEEEKPAETRPDPERDPLPPPTVKVVPDPGAPREMFLGLSNEELPEVAGVEEGELRFAAWAAARAGEGGPPLLGYGRVGLGTAAALMVDPEAPGAKELREDREFPRLMAQLVRSLLPDARSEPVHVEYELLDGRTLAISVLGEDGLPRTDLPIEATLEGSPLVLRRRAGRFEAVLTERASVGRVRLRIPSLPAERSFVVPPSFDRELERLGPDRPALLRLAGAAQRLDAAPEVALRRPVRLLTRSQPVGLPFLLLAAILLPLDAWARRRASR